MTETLISLISIVCGVMGANMTGFIAKRYSFGITGNSIAGVFGSIFFLKLFGRLGFDPISIMCSGSINVKLFILNSLVSILGGCIAIIVAKSVKRKMKTD